MQRCVSRRRLGHHVHEQLLNLAGLVDATRHLPRCGRMPGRHRRPQCFGVAGDPVGYLRQPQADQRPILVGVGGHQVEHVAHRLQRRRDHVQVADIQPCIVQLDLQTEPFTHRRDGHPVDVVNRAGSVELSQRRSGRIDPGRDPVGRVVGDVVFVTDDAHFRCCAWVQRGEGLEVAFGDGVDGGGGLTKVVGGECVALVRVAGPIPLGEPLLPLLGGAVGPRIRD